MKTLIKVQARVLDGIYTVGKFEDGITLVDSNEFISKLPKSNSKECFGTELNEDQFSEIKAKYTIHQ